MSTIEQSSMSAIEQNAEMIQLLQKVVELLGEKSSEQQIDAIKQQSRVLDNIAKKLGNLTKIVEDLDHRVTCAEMRQTETQGEGTDAARMRDAYARGESALLSRHSLSVLVRSIIEFASSRGVEYQVIFGNKDVVRAEAVASYWYLTSRRGETHQWSECEYNDLGTVGQYMPRIRAKLIRQFLVEKEAGKWRDISEDEFFSYFPSVDKDLAIVFELVLPLGTRFQVLEESSELQGIRKASRDLRLGKKTFELLELPKTPEELFSELSEPIQLFFQDFPACKSSDIRTRVTEGLACWRFYGDELARQASVLAKYETYHSEQAKAEIDKGEKCWEEDFAEVTRFMKQNSPKSCNIHTKYEILEAKMKDEKHWRKKIRTPSSEMDVDSLHR